MGPGVRSHVFVGATSQNLVVDVFDILKVFKGTNNILDVRQKSTLYKKLWPKASGQYFQKKTFLTRWRCSSQFQIIPPKFKMTAPDL